MASGLLDTSVVIDWHDPSVVAELPEEELHLLAGQVYRQLSRATDAAPVQAS